MKKLKLRLDDMRVDSFATLPEPAGEHRGTLFARMDESGVPCELSQSCPTCRCVTIPVTCDTFQPTCIEIG